MNEYELAKMVVKEGTGGYTLFLGVKWFLISHKQVLFFDALRALLSVFFFFYSRPTSFLFSVQY